MGGLQFWLFTLYDKDEAADLIHHRCGHQSMKLSRAVLARYLRVNARTLENWEQDRARPNAQAALLIRLVRQYPDYL